jgi:uncharacterized membrane protein YcaP (DUF421 family)
VEQPVTAFDFGRMLFGEEPPLFLLEIAFRTTVIYVYTFVLIRWVGSRSVAQLSLVEFLLVIALGSAVGDAMFYADVPLVHAILVITVVILLEKALTYFVSRSPTLEDRIEGKTVEIVKDGLIILSSLRAQSFGHDELFEQLRIRDIEHLGQVRGAYLETNGSVSVFKQDSERPGLSIVPPWDVAEPDCVKAGETQSKDAQLACEQCGSVLAFAAGSSVEPCPNCSSEVWHFASHGTAD